jgi:replicative DNA helicase
MLLEAEAQDFPLSLDPGALELLHGFEAEVEEALGDGGRFEGIRDWAGKMVGHSVRVAALLELAARAGDGRPLFGSPIGSWAMDGGIRLLRALSTHAMKVLGEAGMDEQTSLLAYALGRAKTLPEGSSLRDLFEACRGKAEIDDMADLAPLVAKLEDRGCLRLVSPPSREGPGRPPSPTVELHPNIVKSLGYPS